MRIIHEIAFCAHVYISDAPDQSLWMNAWPLTNTSKGSYSLQRNENSYNTFGMTFTLGDKTTRNLFNISDDNKTLLFDFHLQSTHDTGGTLRLFSQVLQNKVLISLLLKTCTMNFIIIQKLYKLNFTIFALLSTLSKILSHVICSSNLETLTFRYEFKFL